MQYNALSNTTQYGKLSPTMATNVEINRKKNENNGSILKRFTRRVQESGVLPKVRSLRYDTREVSSNMRKFSKLKQLTKTAEREKMIKLGKIVETRGRRR